MQLVLEHISLIISYRSHGGGTSTVSATPVNVSGENCHDWKSPKLLLDERNDSADDGDPEEKLSRMSYEKQESQLSWQSEPKDSSMTSPYMGNSVGDASITDANGKKSRPKRGKYRNYDRDALLKAVRAVQNGEMSVHRAGKEFENLVVDSDFFIWDVVVKFIFHARNLLRCASFYIRVQSEGTSLTEAPEKKGY